MNFPAPSRLRLDSAALVNNWKTMARLSGSAATGAAVKANAYGLGAREVVPRLWAAGCRDFFVAHWGEAEDIADLVPTSNIAVLNGVCGDDIAKAKALGAVPVLNTPKQIALWKAHGGGRCHVMLDSGINRLGIGPEQFGQGLFAGLEIDILMSHLASADEDCDQNRLQLKQFVQISDQVTARRRSLANSAGIGLGSDFHFELTRPGISLYGGMTNKDLRQVVFPEARVLQVRTLPPGSPVGYNSTFISDAQMHVATLAIGYADGYARALSNVGTVLLDGKERPIIGRVSMDLVTIEIGDASNLKEDDWVSLSFDLSCTSERSGVSPYELLTRLGNRSVRYWV